MSRRTGLGRGLAALIPPSEPDPVEGPDTGDTREPEDAGTVEGPSSGDDAPRGGELQEHATTGPTDAAPEDPSPAVRETEDAPEPVPDPAVADAGGTSVRGPASYAELSPEAIQPNPRQPREVFDPEEIEGLATSLADIGMLQPLVVRPLADGSYELIAGERRLRAAKLAGLTAVPALVRHTEDGDLLKEALVENIHRVQLNPLEEGAAYAQLLDEFGVTQDELAARLGRSRPAISNAIRLLQLPAAVQRRVAAGVLTAGHAKALLAVPDTATQSTLADRIVAEGLSVRATEELVRLKLTDGTEPRPRGRSRQPTAPGILELQDDLSDALQTRVRIAMGARKGKLSIEFTSVDDLERLVAIIADGLGAASSSLSSEAPTLDPDDLDLGDH